MLCPIHAFRSLDEKSHTGHTALLSAANSGKQEVVEWLLDNWGVSAPITSTNSFMLPSTNSGSYFSCLLPHLG